ncbi:MAG: hypothetical protein R3A48_23245 [Polyangiales bacterium]
MLRLTPGTLLGAALALGCTTSFDPSELPVRDAGADRATPSAASCGVEGLPCCEDAGPRCAPGAICNEGRCQRCPGGTSACGGACVDTQTNLTHCGGCDRPCPQGQSCAAGSCVLLCPAPLTACDGACVDVARNGSHCGGCGRRCAALEVCAGGSCTAVCAPGEARCAEACVDLSSDAANCGRCGVVCPGAEGTARCVAGRCESPGCLTGFADCDGDTANGCETPTTSIASCGRCGRACDVPNATARCADGACLVGECGEGFADCDRSPANGCEVNTASDPMNCGGCGSVCVPASGARATCVNGVCGTSSIACSPDTADCDGAPANRCEADLATSLDDCGRCGNRCAVANGAAACRAGTCGLASCAAPYRDCDGVVANGCETDTRVAIAHCGACGAACVAPRGAPACVEGRCVVAACDEGRGDCDGDASNGCETDVTSSVMSCGRCGNRCAVAGGTPACVEGRCAVASCEPARGDCDRSVGNGCETDLRADLANCGGCGRACVLPNATPRCDGGRCVVERCNEGFGDCDGDAANGCETDLRSSVAHCGRCDRGCRGGANSVPVCASGTCGATCVAGYGDCDRNPENGCETRTLCNAFHCGACGNRCPLGQGCCDRQCRFLAGLTCLVNGVECR